MKLCIPVTAPNGLASMIEPHLPQANYLFFFDTELRSCHQMSMNELNEDAEIPMDAVLCGSINRILLKTLIEQGIAVYGTEAQTVEQAIAQFENGELQAAVLGGGCSGHGHAHPSESGRCCSGQNKEASDHGCGGSHGGCGSHGKETGHKHGHSHAHAGGGCCGSRAATADTVEIPALGDVFKIAVCSQNRKTVTEHAGKCRKFWVYDVAEGRVVGRNLLELTIEQSFHEAKEGQAHPLDEVDVLITGSIGGGLQQRLKQRGILGIVTSETDLDQAIADFLAGKIEPAPAAGAGCAQGCGATAGV